jgi:hypothetical protein
MKIQEVLMEILDEYPYDGMSVEWMKKLNDVQMLFHHLVMLETHYLKKYDELEQYLDENDHAKY